MTTTALTPDEIALRTLAIAVITAYVNTKEGIVSPSCDGDKPMGFTAILEKPELKQNALLFQVSADQFLTSPDGNDQSKLPKALTDLARRAEGALHARGIKTTHLKPASSHHNPSFSVDIEQPGFKEKIEALAATPEVQKSLERKIAQVACEFSAAGNDGKPLDKESAAQTLAKMQTGLDQLKQHWEIGDWQSTVKKRADGKSARESILD